MDNRKIYNQGNGYKSIIHIDRLNLTYTHQKFAPFKNVRNPDAVSEKQQYGDIELVLDNRCGSNAYYHTFGVYYKGIKVGKLHSASKMGKPDIEFDYEKHVHYSGQRDYWYEIYKAIISELGLKYNNINYIEICVDSNMDFPDMFGKMHANSIANKYRESDFFKPFRNFKVEVLDNGYGFRIKGKSNSIHIYNKTNHSQDFIKDFFNANELGDEPVYRLECRLNWNYLKYLINKKSILVAPEILLNERMIAGLFEMSVRNKLTFYDLRTTYFDESRNPQTDKVSILDDIHLCKTELLVFNPMKQSKHYKNENIDEDIIKKTYYIFLETGKKKYFENIRHNADAAQMNDSQVLVLIHKFNQKYRGDRSCYVTARMDYTIVAYQRGQGAGVIGKILGRMRISLKMKPSIFI